MWNPKPTGRIGHHSALSKTSACLTCSRHAFIRIFSHLAYFLRFHFWSISSSIKLSYLQFIHFSRRCGLFSTFKVRGRSLRNWCRASILWVKGYISFIVRFYLPHLSVVNKLFFAATYILLFAKMVTVCTSVEKVNLVKDKDRKAVKKSK